MASRRDLFYKYKLPHLQQILENQSEVNSEAQIGGKVLTRAAEKKLNVSASEQKEAPNLYNDPVPSTSTNQPPLMRAYKKTAQRNIVSNCIQNGYKLI